MLLSIKVWAIQNSKMAKNGMKNTLNDFRLNSRLVIKAANITDHQGRNIDKIKAKAIVVIKFKSFLFMVLKSEF